MNFPPPAPLPPPVDDETAYINSLQPGEWELARMQPILTAPPPLLAAPGGQPVVVPRLGPKINVRAKGQRGEREVVKLLQAVVDNVRSRYNMPMILIQRNQMQSHMGGEDLTGLQGFAVEVKFQENENLPAWWRQCVQQAAARGAVPILFWRCSRAKWSVKFRAFVNTPADGDQIEMDVETSVEDFIEWFGNAFEERVKLKLPL